MDLEQRLRAGLGAPDPGPTFTARVMARVGRRAARRRSGVIMMGTVLVVGAAAAMLAWRMADVSGPEEVDAIVASSDPALPMEEVAAVQSVPDPKPAAAAAPVPEPASGSDAPRFTVVVMPLRHEVEEPGKRRPVEALHAALLAELRRIPGITVRIGGEEPRAQGGHADYVLTMTNLATSVSPGGRVALRATDGGNRYSVQGTVNGAGGYTVQNSVNAVGGNGSQPVNPVRTDAMAPASGSAAASYGSGAVQGVVGLMLNNRMAGIDIDYTDELMGGTGLFSGGFGSIGNVSIGDRVVSFNGGSLRSPASMSWVEIRVEPRQTPASRYTFPLAAEGAAREQLCSAPGPARPAECMTPAQLAAVQVARFRLQLFPADAAYQQRVIARMGVASRDASEVLQDLLPLVTIEGGTRLDAATTQALFRYVARHPADLRARVWTTLGRVTLPALVAPLVESLRADPDRDVRLAALTNLEANFLADPAVRGALEAIDRGEPDAVVRAAARWALHGEGQWRSDVLAALQDTGLPYEARVAPLAVRAPAQHTLQMYQLRRAVLQDEQVRVSAMALVRENLRDATHAQTTGELLQLLGNVDDPAIAELFLQLMREPSLPMPVSSAVSNWALNHRGDPRVRESLPTAQVVIPSALVERMGEVTGQPPPMVPPPTDLTVIRP